MSEYHKLLNSTQSSSSQDSEFSERATNLDAHLRRSRRGHSLIMSQASAIQQFLILLYKGLLLRKRHYVITVLEIFIPVLITTLPAILMSILSSPPDANKPEFEKNFKPELKNSSLFPSFSPFSSKTPSIYKLYFVHCPESSVTDQLMLDAVQKFQTNLNYKGNISSTKVKSESDMEAFSLYKQREREFFIMIGVVFNNFNENDNEIPSSLDYKIRYGNADADTRFGTSLKYRVNGPQKNNIYFDTLFLAWQASIEQSFIQQKMAEKGKDTDFKISMQRFPYPEQKDSTKIFSIINIIPWFFGFGYLTFMCNLVRRIIEEKANGSKELLKMMGMTDSVYWLSTFMNYFLFSAIMILITTIVFKAPLKNSFVFLKNIDFLALYFLLLLFAASLILFSMAFSIFFNRAIFAILVLLIVYIVSLALLIANYFIVFKSDLNYLPLPQISKLGICLLPSGALLSLFYIISFYEFSGEGLQWSNMNEFSAIPDLNVILVIIAMIVSCFLYSIAIWYFDKTWPWQNGVPQPFYFPFTKHYWCGSKDSGSDEIQLVNHSDSGSEFFEEEPSGAAPGVIISNLSKEFRTGFHTKLAVNNVSLNIYQGQITALLGHNGAGKTTTINILTGMYLPSGGTATINGVDVLKETVRARKGVGVCPQHNVLFDTLTVEEHLKFYAVVKGVSCSNTKVEIETVLNTLKLVPKRNELAKNLSGGMKRKLSLGIAIIGGSKVLFLDEPTSGMDVEARRIVWDALLEIRHNRTIVLTTHYMEEADVLGDRIVIMAEGEVQCCGSPIFLKNKFGTGYHLHVVKSENFDGNDLTSLIMKHIPGSALEKELEREVSYNLGTSTGEGFAEMFSEIDKQKSDLGITSYGITVTTMEDVFLNVANISDKKYKINSETPERLEDIAIEAVDHRKADFGNKLNLGNQFIGLLLKRFHYAKRHWLIWIAQLIIPLAFITICHYKIKSTGNRFQTVYDPLKLDIENVYGNTIGFFTSNKNLPEVSNTYQEVLKENQVSAKEVLNPTQYILEYGKNDLSSYIKKFLVGGVIDQFQNGTYNLTAWYNGEPWHALPLSLSIMHNALLRTVQGSGTITLTNAPLPIAVGQTVGGDFGGQLLEREMASVFIPLALGFLSASYVFLPTHERMSKAKLLQLMTGTSAAMYWLTSFLWDFLMHSIVSIILLIPFAIFNSHAFFSPGSDAIGTALLLFLVYGWASIPFSYLMSFLFKSSNVGFSVIILLATIFGTGFVSILVPIVIFSNGYAFDEIRTSVWVLRLFPGFSVSLGFSNLFGIAFHNGFCDAISPQDLQQSCQSPTMKSWNVLYKCCKDLCGDSCLQQIYPITWDRNACGRDLFSLLFDGLLYFFIIFLLEVGVLTSLARILKYYYLRLKSSVMGEIKREGFGEDSEVIMEEERVRNLQVNQPRSSGVECLVALDLTKVYSNFYAVDHLTFSVHPEECFGLLGVNGAGKTTTFRMLTGDCNPTEGNAFIQNFSIRTSLKKFQSHLGYCPQFDALIDRNTGREMLYLFGRLRGLSGHELKNSVENLIKVTDLTDHADKQTRFLSGGNKRKLSVGIALIGSPPLILLDEPTAGVDPVSRRKIWKVLAKARQITGTAIILTTHSMEECESLCGRLAIMVNGRFRCLGSIQQLKSQYGQGYTLVVKIKREEGEEYRAKRLIQDHIEKNLGGASLKDDHQCLLQYHILDPSETLGHLFEFMADMKSQFDIDDYLISDTSLEQIFLTFARTQRLIS